MPATLASIGISSTERQRVIMGAGPSPTEEPDHGGWNPIKMVGRLGSIIGGIPKGAAQLASDVVRTPYHAARGAVLGRDVDWEGALPGVFGIKEGAQATAGRLASFAPGGQTPGEALRPYLTDPVGTIANDLGVVAPVAGVGARVAGIATKGAAAGTLAARVQSASQAVEAGAGRLDALQTAPIRYPITKLGEALGQRTLRGLESASGSDVRVPLGGKALAKAVPGLLRFSPETKALNAQLLEGKAQEAGLVHERMEADTGTLREQLEAAPKDQHAQIMDEWSQQHHKDALPEIDAIRAATVERVGNLPFAVRGERTFAAGRHGVQGETDAVFGPPPEVGLPEPTQFTVTPKGSAKRSYLEAPEVPSTVPAGYVRASEIHTGGGTARPLKDGDDVAIPSPLAEHIETFFQGPSKGSQKLGKVTDPANRVAYSLKLGLNPAWAVGNALGNATMVTAASGLKGLRQYVSDVRTGDFATDSARLQKAAPAQATMDQVRREAGSQGGAIDRATGKLQGAIESKSLYRLAERFDNAAKSAVFKTEIAKGSSPDLAMERTLRATGEFDNLSPFERDYIKKLAPFYTWHREILKIGKNLAEDHPFAAGALGGLGQDAADKEVVPGETEWEGQQLVPFGQVGDALGGGYLGFGKMLGILPKAAVGITTGANPSTGKDLRVGQAFGEQNTPGIHNAGAAGAQALRGLPQVRLIEALRGEDDFHTPGEGLASFLGVDVSHQPEPKPKKDRKKKRRIIT